MGDMADFTLESCFTMNELQLCYLAGDMTIEEAIDTGVLDQDGGLIPGSTWPAAERGTPVLKTCRCCGQEGLRWMNCRGKWMLGDGANVHKCPVNPYDRKEE